MRSCRVSESTEARNLLTNLRASEHAGQIARAHFENLKQARKPVVPMPAISGDGVAVIVPRVSRVHPLQAHAFSGYGRFPNDCFFLCFDRKVCGERRAARKTNDRNPDHSQS